MAQSKRICNMLYYKKVCDLFKFPVSSSIHKTSEIGTLTESFWHLNSYIEILKMIVKKPGVDCKLMYFNALIKLKAFFNEST
jgi:hypothetical protein